VHLHKNPCISSITTVAIQHHHSRDPASPQSQQPKCPISYHDTLQPPVDTLQLPVRHWQGLSRTTVPISTVVARRHTTV
jgi:hypothetical protein